MEKATRLLKILDTMTCHSLERKISTSWRHKIHLGGLIDGLADAVPVMPERGAPSVVDERADHNQGDVEEEIPTSPTSAQRSSKIHMGM